MARDNFYAVGMNQDQWDEIFGKGKDTPVCHGVTEEDFREGARILKNTIDAQGLELIIEQAKIRGGIDGKLL